MFETKLTALFNSKLFAYFVIVVSGLLTPLAFAPYRYFWLMPILLGVFLLAAFSKKTPIRHAYLWGVCAYGAQFYWLYHAIHGIAGVPVIYAVPLSGLFPAYLALYPMFCFWVLGYFKLSKNKQLVFVFPLLWVVFEYVRERALTGFGWGALGYSQVSESPLAGYAPLGGLYLVTFFVALITALLVFVLRSKNFRHSVCALMASVLLIGIGAHLKNLNFTQATGEKTVVALAQGNIPQDIKWQEDQALPTMEKYYEMVSGTTNADIMILPETALPFFQEDIPDVIGQFALAAQKNNMALVVGMSRFAENESNFLNVAVNLTDYQADKPLDQPYYAKNHLVPFGEYIPVKSLLGKIYEKINIPLVGVAPGGDAQKPLLLANQKVAFNICYEDGFGDELIESAKQSTLLANISNMAWYGDSYAMDLHLQQSQMRALELGRYMVRSTNTGMTAVINPKGEIEALAAPKTRQVLTHSVEGRQGLTPFMKMGSSSPLVLLLAILLGVIYGTTYFAHSTHAGSTKNIE